MRRLRAEEVVMGIDRIGKGPPAAPGGAVPGSGGPSDATRAEKAPFEARKEAPAPAAAVNKANVTPLARLRAGEVDVNGYLDLKVEEATLHLKGLGAEELAAVRRMLRQQIAADPALAVLVQRATGKAPEPNE